MTVRIARDPSPIRSALVHGSLGFAALVGTLGLGGTAIHFSGDADAASPSLRMALFEHDGAPAPGLNPRLPSEDAGLAVMARGDTANQRRDDRGQPDLGVEYAGAARVQQASATPPQRAPSGIRINGQNVLPGQSLSQVQDAGIVQTTAQASPEPIPSVMAAAATAPTKTTFERYARSFVNTENKPTVSIIIGGLGINRRRTQAAISELPPEITLSFAPTSSNLQSWVRKARAAGHEVLIELPMEPYEYGRERPHPQVLQVSAGSEANTRRLQTLLARVRGYAGVMNYQGGKFATSAEAASPVFDMLGDKGLAFFEDGSLTRSVFEASAIRQNVTFGKAGAWIDARPEADEINTQLMTLQAQALETGAAMGMGMSYPVTVDLLKDWIQGLEAKGIVLAPASHFAKLSTASSTGQIKVAALDPQG